MPGDWTTHGGPVILRSLARTARSPVPLPSSALCFKDRFEERSAEMYGAIGPIAIHLPERVETIEDLRAEFPSWDLDLIYAKTGIYSRHIAAPGECASDLAFEIGRAHV